MRNIFLMTVVLTTITMTSCRPAFVVEQGVYVNENSLNWTANQRTIDGFNRIAHYNTYQVSLSENKEGEKQLSIGGEYYIIKGSTLSKDGYYKNGELLSPWEIETYGPPKKLVKMDKSDKWKEFSRVYETLKLEAKQ